jgi:hypothetical protein
MAHTLWLDKQGYMHLRALTRPRARVHARTRKHAHTDQYVTLIAFPQPQLFRKRASMFRYTYIACLVGSRRDVEEATVLVRHDIMSLDNRLSIFQKQRTGFIFRRQNVQFFLRDFDPST